MPRAKRVAPVSSKAAIVPANGIRTGENPGSPLRSAYYGEHYGFFTQLSRRGCRYVIRLIEKTAVTTVEEELPITKADAAAGVVCQAKVRLGQDHTLSEVLRVIWFSGTGGQLIMLATNMAAEDLIAGNATRLYRRKREPLPGDDGV